MVTFIGLRVKEDNKAITMIDRVRGSMTRSQAIKKLLTHVCDNDDYVKQVLGVDNVNNN